MKILVTGAAGFIGAHVVRALCHKGHQVVCCGRDTSRLLRLFPACAAVDTDFSRHWKQDQWLTILKDVDVIVNAVGIIQEHGRNSFVRIHQDGPIAMFGAAQRTKVRRVIQISALGADEKGTTAYHRTKKVADDFLANLSLEWIILRPSIVFGTGARSQEFFAALAALPLIPLAGDGNQRIQPVWVMDLVAAVSRLVEPNTTSRQRFDVVGPEPIPMRSYLELLRGWLGLPATKTIWVPLRFIRALGIVGGFFRWEFVNSSTISMLCREKIGDPGPLAQIVGAPTRSCAEVFAATPCREADRWHAGLYFLRPLFRISIAAVWMAAGLLSLFVFPQQESESLLIRAGVFPTLAQPVLIGVSLLDIGLGVGTLLRWRLGFILAMQAVLIVAFSTSIAVSLPEFWLHPFGPLVKNGPLFVGTLILLVMERK